MASTRRLLFCLSRRKADTWRSLGRQFTVVATFGHHSVLVQLVLVKE